MKANSVSQSAKLIQIMHKSEMASMEFIHRKATGQNSDIYKQDDDYLLNNAMSNQVFDIVNKDDMKNMASSVYKNKRRYRATNKAVG